MGRIETEAPQHPPETIDDAPPPDEDLYEPPSDYQPPPPQAFPPPQDQHHPFAPPQAFPPAQDQHHPFPPPQDHHQPAVSFPPPQDQHQPAVSFPPPQDHHQPAVSFPPPQDHHQPAVSFPPPQDYVKPPPPQAQDYQKPQFQPFPNQYIQQQPNVAVMQQQQQGIPLGMGYTPSPFNPQHPTQRWRSSLFDCMNNPQNAIITLFFPCVTFGQIAEILDSGTTSCGTSGLLYSLIACCIAMPCIMSCTYRTKLRSKYGLAESPGPDWLIHCFCEYCALCQEYRELQERGFDPAIGWMGNVAKQQQQQQYGMTPPMQQRMM